MIAGVALLAATLPSFAQNPQLASHRPASGTIASVRQMVLPASTMGWPTCLSADGAPAKFKCSPKIFDLDPQS
jgi:hypothetical protein